MVPESELDFALERLERLLAHHDKQQRRISDYAREQGRLRALRDGRPVEEARPVWDSETVAALKDLTRRSDSVYGVLRALKWVKDMDVPLVYQESSMAAAKRCVDKFLKGQQ